jgi:hypothetical protein
MQQKEIRKQLDYALASKSHDLLYQTLGYINACRALDALTREEYVDLSSECCRGINDPNNT